MKMILMLVAAIVSTSPSYSQGRASVAGVYNLEGVRETASGFKLNEDSTFEFYFSYGALDRFGSGRWRASDSSIVMNSTVTHASDFKLLNSVPAKTNYSIIEIKEENKFFYQFLYCRIASPKGDTVITADENGRIKLPFKVDSIELLFELCPEKSSRFTISKSVPKVYTYRFEPWITELSFKDYKLQYKPNLLQGKHPLLTGENYVFAREDGSGLDGNLPE